MASRSQKGIKGIKNSSLKDNRKGSLYKVGITAAQLMPAFLSHYDTLPIRDRVDIVAKVIQMLKYDGSPFTVFECNAIVRNIRMIADKAYSDRRYTPYGSYQETIEKSSRKRIITMLNKALEENVDYSSNVFFNNIMQMSKLFGIDPEKLLNSDLINITNEDVAELESLFKQIEHDKEEAYRKRYKSATTYQAETQYDQWDDDPFHGEDVEMDVNAIAEDAINDIDDNGVEEEKPKTSIADVIRSTKEGLQKSLDKEGGK